MKGRPRDPKRTARRTGHRRKPDEAPALKAVPVPAEATALAEELSVVAPEDLPPAAREVWDRLVGTLGEMPLRPADAFGLELMVRMYQRAKRAGELVDQYDVLARKATGEIAASPFVKLEREEAAMFLRFAEHYGLTVAARMRLGLMQLAGKTMHQALMDDLQS